MSCFTVACRSTPLKRSDVSSSQGQLGEQSAGCVRVMFAARDRHDDSSREPIPKIHLLGIGERTRAGATRFEAQLIEEAIE